MRDAGGKLSNRFQLLRLPQLLFKGLSLRGVSADDEYSAGLSIKEIKGSDSEPEQPRFASFLEPDIVIAGAGWLVQPRRNVSFDIRVKPLNPALEKMFTLNVRL